MPLSDLIPDGYKYALLAMRVDCPRLSDQLSGKVTSELSASLYLPVDVPTHWQKWLGELRIKELASANLFLTISRKSMSPEILDHENLALTKHLDRIYCGLLISASCIGHPQATAMTGACQGNQVDVRRVETLDAACCAAGCAGQVLDAVVLRSAMQVAEAIEQIEGHGEYSRVWRATSAFYSGLRASEPGDRVHQLFRCLEGFVIPKRGETRKQVISRSRLFVNPPQDDVVGHLFDIRSAVEHLHGPSPALDGPDLRARNLLLAQRVHEIESLARYCLRTLFLRPELWPFFVDDASLHSFWALEESNRAELWGDPLLWSSVASAFDARKASIQLGG